MKYVSAVASLLAGWGPFEYLRGSSTMPRTPGIDFMRIIICWLAAVAGTLLLAATPAAAATYNYSAATDICGAGGLTITVNVGDTVRISDTQTTCGTGNITGMSNRGTFSFIPNGPDFIAQVITTPGGVGTGTVTWTGGAVFSITVVAITPAVTTTAASAITVSGATLNGQVTSNGAVTTTSFDYGLTTAYGSNAPVAGSLTATANAAAITTPVTGLACTTTYHYRAKGVNSAGTTNGSDQTFTTAACPAVAVATTSEWTLILIGVLLAAGAVVVLQRRGSLA